MYWHVVHASIHSSLLHIFRDENIAVTSFIRAYGNLELDLQHFTLESFTLSKHTPLQHISTHYKLYIRIHVKEVKILIRYYF